MTEPGKKWGKGTAWSDTELKIVIDNISLPPAKVAALLPGRSLSAVYNVHYRVKREMPDALDALRIAELSISYAVKEPGEYLETLSAYFMEHPECVEVWLRWNGYVTYRELCRDMSSSPLGTVTLLCQAKLWSTR